jgi:ribokinase
MATRLDVRDFCKQHIILHYLSVLLRDLGEPVEVIPIGAVGDDDMGHELLRLMERAGLRLSHVKVRPHVPTMSAVCYQFPDGTGGNLTEQHSAGAKVSPAQITAAVRNLGRTRGRLMVLAAPEVPLASRVRLLRLGRRQNAFNVASFTVEEVPAVRRRGLLQLVDLIGLNIDEAAALGQVRPGSAPDRIVAACRRAVARVNPALQVAVTHGGDGAYAFDGPELLFLPALNVRVASTAGAGDAFLAGLMLGVIKGLPLVAADRFCEARLARALAALSVTSPDTIHLGVTAAALAAFYRKQVRDEPPGQRAGNFLLAKSFA